MLKEFNSPVTLRYKSSHFADAFLNDASRVLSDEVRPAPASLGTKVIVLRASSTRARPDLSYPTRLPRTAEPIARGTSSIRACGD